MREVRDGAAAARLPGGAADPAAALPEEAVAAAKEAAVRLLAARARSAAELAERLARRGFPPPVVTAVLDWCRERGYVDDERFTEDWIRARLARQPAGRERLEHELVQMGIAPELARRQLDHLLPADEEESLCLTVARELSPRYRGLPPEVRARRLGGALCRRGFSLDAVERALAQVDSDCEKH
ncbi:MAG TPA: regulatory protein RecX [Limnochordales bacterium]